MSQTIKLNPTINDNIETYRIEKSDDSQGGIVTFNWKTGHTKAVWDDGNEENWHLHGIALKAKAEAYLNLTEQYHRLDDVKPIK